MKKTITCRSVHYPAMLVVAQQYRSCDVCEHPTAMYRQDGTDRALCHVCARAIQQAIDRLTGGNRCMPEWENRS